MRCVVPTLLLLAVAGAEDTSSTTIPGFTADGTAAEARRSPLWGEAPTETRLVVTADRTANDVERTTASVTVLTASDLRENGYAVRTPDLVRSIAGVDLPGGAGFLGANGDARLRGTSGGDTRLLLDGVPVRDGSSINGQFPLGDLDPTGVDRVEIVRGPQSGLHGSGAIGGVINFQTRRPTDENVVGVQASAGSFGTATTEVWATGTGPAQIGYALTVGGLHTDGYSAQTTRDQRGAPTDHERDGADRGTLALRLEAQPLEVLRIYGQARHTATNEEYDSSQAPQDRVSSIQRRMTRGGAGGELDLGRGGLALDLARTRTTRTYQSAYGPSDYVGVDDFGGLRLWGDALQPGRVRTGFDRLRLTLGTDLEVNRGETTFGFDATDRQRGGWAQALAGGRWWEFSQVVRRDLHSREGGAGTWRSGAAILTGPVKIHGSVGTAFRAPGVYELFDPTYGNPDAKPVRSRGYDLGHQTRIPGGLTLAQVAFRTDYQQNLGYDPATYVTTNTEGYRVEGVENTLTIRDGELGLRLRVVATLQRTDLTEDQIATRGGFAYQPRRFGAIEPAWHAERWWVKTRLTVRGPSTYGATVYPPPTYTAVTTSETLAGSAVLSAAAGWALNRTWEIYARGENLASTRWASYPSNSTSPLAGYGGVTATF